MRLFVILLAALAAIFGATAALAADEARNLATPAISADGRTVYFSYWGDIWSAPSDGRGFATRLTDNVAHEERPAISPDGSQIAFTSDRFGNYDIFVMPEAGGEAQRLTWHSSADLIYGWRPDGQAVVEYTLRQELWGSALFEVPLAGGDPLRLAGPDHDDQHFGSYLGDSGKIVYARGPGDWASKKYRGTFSHDIWVYDSETKQHQQITTHNGKDLWPQPSPDGSSVYFVSDRDGTENIWRHDFASGQQTQLTFFKVDGPRWPRISSDGDELVFEVFGELFKVSTAGGAPHRIPVLFADDPKHEMEITQDVPNGAGEKTISPNGNYFALTVLGDVFILKNPEKYEEEEKPDQDLSRTRPVVQTSGREMQLSWHYKSTKLAYLSDREGQFDVYVLDLQTETEQRITNTPADEYMPLFAPWGDKLAYYSGPRKLCVYDLATNTERVLHQGDLRAFAEALGYSWSPDARWIAFSQYLSKRDDLTDVFVVGVEEGSTPVNITRSADWSDTAAWSPDGKYIAYQREPYYFEAVERGADIVLLELNPKIEGFDLELLFPEDNPEDETEDEKKEDAAKSDAAPPAAAEKDADSPAGEGDNETEAGKEAEKEEDKQPEPIIINFDRIHLRGEVITDTPGDAGGMIFSPDSKYLIYQSSHEGVGNLYSFKIEDKTRVNLGPAEGKSAPEWYDGGKRIYYLERGMIKYFGFNEGNVEAPGAVPTTSEVTHNQHQLWEQMLVEGWRYLKDYFYDPTMNNTDWEDVLRRYRARIPHLGTKDEYGRLYREMLGELGRSHLGYFNFGSHREAPPEITASLGVVLSEDYPGPGWHVRRVLHDGPADIGGSRLYAGDVILAINDVPIAATDSRDQRLRNLADFPVKLRVKSSETAKTAIKAEDPEAEITDERDVLLKPIPVGAEGGLLYEDWVEQNRAEVAELSGSRIGYQHIQSMDEESLARFRNELLTDSYDKDALIIDVRFNGGGFTSVAVMEVLRRQAAYKRFRRETGEYSYARQQVWDGPVVLLINAHSFSNAEILAHVFKDLNIATLVGETTGGNVISTSAVTLMDGSVLRMPGIGNARLDGSDMEGQGAVPDIAVHIDPYLLTLGRDNQIEAAVAFLLAELGEG